MAVEYHPIEVTFSFKLPDHERELRDFENSELYGDTLWEIYQECRSVWNNEDKSVSQRQFAEQICKMISATGVMHEK